MNAKAKMKLKRIDDSKKLSARKKVMLKHLDRKLKGYCELKSYNAAKKKHKETKFQEEKYKLCSKVMKLCE